MWREWGVLMLGDGKQPCPLPRDTRGAEHRKAPCALSEGESGFHGPPSKGTWSDHGRLLTTHHTAPTKKDPAEGTGAQGGGGK